MKHEFESLIGHRVSFECYERIEFVYCELEHFTKETIASFYNRYDMNGIEKLYACIKGGVKWAVESVSMREEILSGRMTVARAMKRNRESMLNHDLDRVAQRREARAVYVHECYKQGIEPDDLANESPRKRTKKWFENRFAPADAEVAFNIYQKVQEAGWPFNSFAASRCGFHRHDPLLLKLNDHSNLGHAEWRFDLETVLLGDWFYAAADVTPM